MLSSKNIREKEIKINMTRKPNCWEFSKCGREPGGVNAEELGVCLTSIHTQFDGINGGKNGGEFAGPFQGLYAMVMFRVPLKKSKGIVWLAVFIKSY